MSELNLVQDLAIVTFFAGVCGFLCQKLGLSSVVGFLLAGLLVGPHTRPFAMVADQERIEALSQLGLVFLMFSIGLHLSLAKLRRMGIGRRANRSFTLRSAGSWRQSLTAPGR